jgi:hypothetical protein
MPLKYHETADIELQPLSPPTSTRGSGQWRSDFEHDIHSAAPTASSSKRTTDVPGTSTKLTHALEHLSQEIDTQDAKIKSEAFTSDTKRLPIDHELRKVRDWVKESVKRTQTGFRHTLPPLSPGVDRFLTGRAGSRDTVTRKAVGLIWAEAESMARETADSTAIKDRPGGERRERDKAEVKEVIASWGASV